MKKSKEIYPIGGFPKDKFGFPHYEEIQKTNQRFNKFYIQELEQRKLKHRQARGAIHTAQWRTQAAIVKKKLLKLLNLEKVKKNPKPVKPVVTFKSSFSFEKKSYGLTKFEIKTGESSVCFTEVFSHSVKATNLIILIPSTGPGHTNLQTPQELLQEFLPLVSASCKILIPHFDSLANFSSTHNKGLLIQGRSQLSEMIHETIQVINHYIPFYGAALHHMMIGGKNVGATVALMMGTFSTEISGVFAINPTFLAKVATPEALMVPYFNRHTDMEEIIAMNLNQSLFLASTEKLILPKNKNLTLVTKNAAAISAICKWVQLITKPKKTSIQIIPLKATETLHRKFNITKIKSATQWQSTRGKLLAKFKELSALPSKLKPLAVIKMGECFLQDCIRTEYHVQTSKNTRVNLTFYQPINSTGKLPTVFCLPGSGSDVAKLESQYVHEVIAKGWNAISIDARVRLYDFHPSIPESTSMIMQSMFDILTCCDWVFKHPLVETTKVATMGISQGATHSWMLAALEPRICAAAPGCGFCTYDSVINEKVTEYYGGNGNSFLDSHSIYYYIPYLLQYADQQDLCALIAPRALMLICADHDNCFPLSGIRQGGKELKHIYQLLNATENYKLVEFAGPHSMPLDMRETAYRFFEKVFAKK